MRVFPIPHTRHADKFLPATDKHNKITEKQ